VPDRDCLDDRIHTLALSRGIVLLPVVDMNVRLPFSLMWKKDNSSRLLQTLWLKWTGTKSHREIEQG